MPADARSDGGVERGLDHLEHYIIATFGIVVTFGEVLASSPLLRLVTAIEQRPSSS